MPRAITIYRCLRSNRRVGADSEYHDECADIVARNPHIEFKPGLQGVEVDHEVHENTNWDADLANYPTNYLETFRGQLGYIIVSVRLDVLYATPLDFENDPCFYQPDYLRSDRKRNWYIAGRRAIIRVCVERVMQVASVMENK